MDIESIIKKENEIIKQSIFEYRELVNNTSNLIDILSEVAEVNDSNLGVYWFMLKQTQNGLYQSLFATLRRHEIQAQVMLRHSIESACLALYSLSNTNYKDYIVFDGFAAQPVKGILIKAYKYLNKKFPEQSSRIKDIKDKINQYYAHGNMFSAFKTFSKELLEIGYFDDENSFFEQSFIWEIGYLSCIICDMIYQSSEKHDSITRNPEEFKNFGELLTINQELRIKLIKQKSTKD